MVRIFGFEPGGFLFYTIPDCADYLRENLNPDGFQCK